MKDINIKEIPQLLTNIESLNNKLYNLKERISNPYLKILNNILQEFSKEELEQTFIHPANRAFKFEIYEFILKERKLETLFSIILDKKIKEEIWHPIVKYINDHQKEKSAEVISGLYNLQKVYNEGKKLDIYYLTDIFENINDLNIVIDYFQKIKEKNLFFQAVIDIVDEKKVIEYLRLWKKKGNNPNEIGLENFLKIQNLEIKKTLNNVLLFMLEGFQFKEFEDNLKEINLILLNNLKRKDMKEITQEIIQNIDFKVLKKYDNYKELIDYIMQISELKIYLNYNELKKEIKNDSDSTIIRKKI